MYFDEDLLLDLRLNSLNRFVKKFVITEATYTHNGSKKDLKFDINKFQKFKDKIIYLVVDNQPNNILDLIPNKYFNSLSIEVPNDILSNTIFFKLDISII